MSPRLFSGQARNPVPEHLVDVAGVPGLPSARFWGDVPPEDMAERITVFKQQLAGLEDRCIRWLAISGGGSQGAFAAGLLRGWTESGTRPPFHAVSGISTGAIAAPFALLGSEWDDPLEEVYTEFSTRDLIKRRSLPAAIMGSSFVSTAPLYAVITRYADRRMLQAIADACAEGRRLLVGTTNLDLMRPVVWRLTDIAASGHPDALTLFRKLVLASASIPAAFPPVHMEVEAEGHRFEEMHVDGGATSQVFVYPLAWNMKSMLEEMGCTAKLFVIRNDRLEPTRKVVKPRLHAIAARSISSLIHVQGFGDLYRIFLAAQRDGIEFNVATIPSEITTKPSEQFDPVYMRELFELGRELGKSGRAWQKHPPGYDALVSP
jgi:hypothetical protein